VSTYTKRKRCRSMFPSSQRISAPSLLNIESLQ
jgi:hypothetical protein